MSKTATYIHYGHKEFDINKFEAPKSRQWGNKPRGGLWASRTDAKYGWKQWNNESGFTTCREDNAFMFKISDKANVLYINCVEDVHLLPDQKVDLELTCFKTVDFEQLMSDGIDAIELNLSNDQYLYNTLYGWDCDSILILNPNIIEII